MRLCFEGERLYLGGGQTVGLRDQQGAQVEVLGGELWVTQEGDRRDLVFHGGERFEVERGGVTVLHALVPAQIRLEERRRRRAAAWWRTIRRRLERRLVELGARRVRGSAYRL